MRSLLPLTVPLLGRRYLVLLAACSVCAGCSDDDCGADLMRDPQFCGACDHVCSAPAGEEAICVAGQCRTLTLVAAEAAGGIAIDATHVYFAGPVGVRRATLAAFELDTVTVVESMASVLAVGGADVYYVTALTEGVGLAIHVVSKSGGAPVMLGKSLLSLDLAVAQDVAYVTSIFTSASGSVGGLIRVPKTGEAESLEPDCLFHGLAVDSTDAYCGTYERQTIVRVPLDGAASIDLASTVGFVDGIAVDATDVYWREEGKLTGVPKSGGAKHEIATMTGQPRLAVDDTSLYLRGTPGIWKLPKTGGQPTQLFAGPVSDFALGETHVYFTGQHGGVTGVFRTSK